jgi:hypothetical protein
VPTPSAAAKELLSRALELAELDDRNGAVGELVEMAGDDRGVLESARNEAAMHLHSHPDDWTATGALTLLNSAIAKYGWTDPYDWKVRWSQHRKP